MKRFAHSRAAINNITEKNNTTILLAVNAVDFAIPELLEQTRESDRATVDIAYKVVASYRWQIHEYFIGKHNL